MKRRGGKMGFRRNEKGFTGLEAAIVLIAFVVVAAVFSYVMLGAGFFTTQKSKRVVDTGVQQASSSLTLDGQYIYVLLCNSDCRRNACRPGKNVSCLNN
ncbi:MAG: archaeal flagellin FlaB [Archaeoglobaceae archaeon]|nr:archaeal flagellin FlaB [Archaeoglobaceae archaeon]